MTRPLARLQGITKHFGTVVANDRIDFDLRAGEVHALLGENGSGKTTLMNIFYGLLQPDEGEIWLADGKHEWKTAQDAIASGIAMIPQQFRLVPTLSAVENIAMSLAERGRYRAQLRTVERRLRELSERYCLQVDPTARVECLSMGERQRIEILRALYYDSQIILMDEPTSVLTPMEVDRLWELLAEMVEAENRAIVLTTHKIREVLTISHRVTVLRRGRRVATEDASDLTSGQLVELMIGKRPASEESHASASESPIEDEVAAVRLRNLVAGRAPSGEPALRGVTLDAYPGEILGIAGVEGNGQSELEAVLAGLLPPTSGSVEFPGGQNIAYIPSDRNRYGVIRTFSVAENLLLRRLAATPALHSVPVFQPESIEQLRELVHEFEIYPADIDMRVGQLSGGNAQKVLLARELAQQPGIVVAAQPTLGLDVGAAEFVRGQLRKMAQAGAAVIVISSDLDELMGLSDRIAVMYGGNITGEWPTNSRHLPAIGAAMAGVPIGEPECSA
jgi:ABC-type uncharacterized transport system ATPase subunit